MLKQFAGLVVAIISILSTASTGYGWIDTGHKIVALIAWEDMTPTTRAAVTAILKQHPRFEKDLLLGNETSATQDETDRHVFASASIWPDLVKQQTNPMRNEYNHPQWHFIDIPFVEQGQTTPGDKPAKQPGPQNIVEALNQCMTELKDPNKSAAEKSIDLCWVAHLIGDIHQPLHACTRVSSEFPKGDAGGNDELVLREAPYPDTRANLHFIWDSMAGDFKSEKLDRFEAQGLRTDEKYSRVALKELLTKPDYMDWAKESYTLAVHEVYMDGQLHSAVNHAKRGPTTGPTQTGSSIPGLPAGYLQNGERVAMHQVSLAGYRLADTLNDVFDPKRVRPAEQH